MTFVSIPSHSSVKPMLAFCLMDRIAPLTNGCTSRAKQHRARSRPSSFKMAVRRWGTFLVSVLPGFDGERRAPSAAGSEEVSGAAQRRGGSCGAPNERRRTGPSGG
jgi:hypothetical protein